MQPILSLLLVLFVLSADTYFVFPWLKVSSLFALFAAILILGNPRHSSFFDFSADEKKYLRRFLAVFYLFLAYMLFDDYLHGLFAEKVPSAIVLCYYPFLLFVFRPTNKSKLLFVFLSCYVIYHGLFSLMQLSGSHVTLGSLVANVPFLGVDYLFRGDTPQGIRVTGGYANCIGLAALSGMCAIVFYFASKDKLLKRHYKTFGYLILSLAILFFTETRAAFIGLPIAVLFVEFLTSKYKIKTIKYTVILSAIFAIILFAGGLSYLVETRLLLFDDSSFLSRIQINYYAVVGTWEIAPFLGLPYGSAGQEALIYEAIATGMFKTNMVLGAIHNFTTFHCEPAFYFRSYGLIGFILYSLLYVSLFGYIRNSDKHPLYKKALICVIIFFFLYNLMHNGKIIQSFEFWILLSLDFSTARRATGIRHHEQVEY